MNNDPTLYLHIGLPKTGTTYLQEQVFPKLHWLDYLNKPRSNFLQDGPDPMYGIMDRAFNHSAVIWREFGDEVFAHVTGGPAERAAQSSLLISDEGISKRGCRPFFLRAHLEEFQKKAFEWGFASLKLICVFRRQDQWLGSHYAQISNRIRNASQQDFESFVDDMLDATKYYYSRSMLLDYKILRDQLVQAVGEENVLMLPYELLESDPTTYLGRMLEFLGARDGKIVSQPSPKSKTTSDEARKNARSLSKDAWAIRDRTLEDAYVLRLRPGRLFKALGLPTIIPLWWPEFGRGESIQLTEELKEKVLDVFAQSNRDLAADLGMDLKHYGYYTDPPAPHLKQMTDDVAPPQGDPTRTEERENADMKPE